MIPDEVLERGSRVGQAGGVTCYRLRIAPDAVRARISALRAEIRALEALLPARPPVTLLDDAPQDWRCGQCGSAAHARSIRDGARCVRCAAARAAA